MGNHKVVDFARGGLINLNSLAANSLLDGDQPFVFLGRDDFTGLAGQLRFDGNTLQGDFNGGGVADLSVMMANHYELQASEFML